MRFVIIYDSEESRYKNNQYQKIDAYHTDVNQAIKTALVVNGHQVSMLQANGELRDKLAAIHADFAFNCSSYSRDHKKQAYAPYILNEMNIPFTGSGGKACLNAYDKRKAKRILQSAGIRTPKAVILKQHFSQIPEGLKYPIFVKPVKGGCSFGISRDNLIDSRKDFQERLPKLEEQCGQDMLVEEYLPGREFTVGVLGNQQLRILPIMEFGHSQTSKPPFRSYRLKMLPFEDEATNCPAELTNERKIEIESMTRQAFRALDCRDYARIDFRLNREGQPYVLEINALPNLMPKTSSYAVMARKAGLTFSDLIRTIVFTAQMRYGMIG